MFIEIAQSLASVQHGVVARRQLLAAGFASRTIANQVSNRLLIPVFPAVYAVGRAGLHRQGLWMAGVLAAGEGAVLAFRSAAAAWGVMNFRPSVEVLRHRHRAGLRSHVDIEGVRRSVVLEVRRTRTLPEVDTTEIAGVPVTSMARTLFDLSPGLGWGSLNRLFLEADRLGLIDEEDIAYQLLRSRGRAGARKFRRLVGGRFDEVTLTRSLLEALFLQLCREQSIPAPEVNVIEEGYVPDCLWRRQKLIVELDGASYHRGAERAERDLIRENRLKAAGWEVLRFSWHMVNDHPEEVAGMVRLSLARRS